MTLVFRVFHLPSDLTPVAGHGEGRVCAFHPGHCWAVPPLWMSPGTPGPAILPLYTWVWVFPKYIHSVQLPFKQHLLPVFSPHLMKEISLILTFVVPELCMTVCTPLSVLGELHFVARFRSWFFPYSLSSLLKVLSLAVHP